MEENSIFTTMLAILVWITLEGKFVICFIFALRHLLINYVKELLYAFVQFLKVNDYYWLQSLDFV